MAQYGPKMEEGGGEREREREREKEELFSFSEDPPNIIKESAGLVTPNQTLTTFPTHSSQMHFTSAVRMFPFQAHARRSFSRKVTGEERFPGACPPFVRALLSARHPNDCSSEREKAAGLRVH